MRVRAAKPEDAPGMARVRVDTWRDAYRDIVPQETLARLSYDNVEKFLRRILWEKTDTRSFAFVAENEVGDVVGIAIAGPVLAIDEKEFRGEIYILYILPAYQKQGFGRELVKACAQSLVENNLTPVMLWTFEINPARTFYEKLGGKVVRRKEVEEDGKILTEVGYGWHDAQALCK